MTYANITIANTIDELDVRRGIKQKYEVREEDLRVLVDTGAATLVIGEEMREQLGLPILGEKVCELADGAKAQCKIAGPVSVYFLNRSTVCTAFVLPSITEPLLGCVPIEMMDVIIDSAKEELALPPDRLDHAVLKLKTLNQHQPTNN
jgi:clan AA aspartic protease